MRACGLIVEYNPFHFGHLYHVQEAKKAANADCMMAVMSGSFLQRGEPAIIDKFHRTKAAIASGVDIVFELPYPYAVQSSKLFAEGAVKSLAHAGADAICFGSESGNINDFLQACAMIDQHKQSYEKVLHHHLDNGDSFPTASQKAYKAIGLADIDLVQPNNILGFSYARAINQLGVPVEPLTIKRVQSEYHDQEINASIASATSIRKEIMTHGFSEKMTTTLPATSLAQLQKYQEKSGILHHWEKYFKLLRYKVLSSEISELANIEGIDEGLEYRLKRTVREADSFHSWLRLMKTKRYTQTRLQRCFVHLLTNTTKAAVQQFTEQKTLPYIRLLGLSETGRHYLHMYKKQIDIPVYTNLNKQNERDIWLDEKAQEIYYAPLPISKQQALKKQEFQLPIR